MSITSMESVGGSNMLFVEIFLELGCCFVCSRRIANDRAGGRLATRLLKKGS